MITSLAGGTLDAGSNDFIEIGSNQGSALTVQYGSADSEDLTVEAIRYLVGANGNFKYTSTLNLSIYGGTYNIARGVVYVSNVTTSAGTNSPNVYKITLSDASFNFYGADAAIVRAKSTQYFANSASYINADGCVFTDTYKADHSSSRFLIREDCWYGTVSFTDCDFVGMSIGSDNTGAALANCGTITVGEGCTFTNSRTTFKSGNTLQFFSSKVTLAGGTVLARTDANGSAAVVPTSDAVEISWENPVGYKEYWKRGTTPVYLGETSFTVGDVTYSLVPSEQPTAATENKAYSFKSQEGYLYRYDSAAAVWQISTDGGNTYVNITESGAAPEPDPTPDPDVGCTVTVDGNVTTFPVGTDFATVISAVQTNANKGKVIGITLSADMTLSTSSSFYFGATLKIDLAGHKLTFAMGGRFKAANGFTIQIYSSVAGAEFVFGTTSDGFQPGTGTIIFGSEEYKNTLTVSTAKEIINHTQTSSGSVLGLKFLYCTVNVGSNNLIRMNAKGAGAVTLEMEIVGCNMTAATSIIAYNYSSTLGATANGGVFTKDSYIDVKDTTFTCTADAPLGFFGGTNLADRYFGTVSFTGTIFKNYVLNGELIYSDSSLDYNTYYDTIKDSGYDPAKAITVGKDCEFHSYGATFLEDMSGFAAPNVSLASDCEIGVGADYVRIIANDFCCSVIIDGVTTYYPAGTDFKDLLSTLNKADNTGKEITVILSADMTIGSTINFSSIKNYKLNIDLAGHKLTADADGRIRFGGGFELNIYSSVPGGELVFKTGDDCFQLDSTGVITIGSEAYRNTLTASAVTDLINVSQLADGATLGVKFLYCTVNAGSNGFFRLNAKGAGAVTLEAEIVGCTVNGSSKLVCYNTSSTVGATTNGGVYTVGSYIRAVDTTFACTADEPVGFFGGANLADRYFGAVSFVGCVFRNYTINGEIIYSDEALSYNSYYDTAVAGGYDPSKAITVGKNCVFYGSDSSFLEDMSGFAAPNASVAVGSNLVYTADAVVILDATEHALSDWMSEYGQHWKVCVSCGDGVKLNFASCTIEDGVCTVCGAAEDVPVAPPEGHNYESVVTPPTCDNAGYTTHTCTECGESYVDSYVTATGHTYGEWVVSVAPTCTEGGERSRSCSVCGNVISETVEALGHTEITYAAKAPTCIEAGWDTYVACSVCGYTTNYNELPIIDHSWVDASCDTAKTCSVCTTVSGEALGHAWENATCEAAKTCMACGATEGEALGHSWIDATTEAPKTCTRCGAVEGEKLPPANDGSADEGDADEGAEDTPGEAPEVDHSTCKGGFMPRFWNAIVNFLRRLFGLPKKCVCGKELL